MIVHVDGQHQAVGAGAAFDQYLVLPPSIDDVAVLVPRSELAATMAAAQLRASDVTIATFTNGIGVGNFELARADVDSLAHDVDRLRPAMRMMLHGAPRLEKLTLETYGAAASTLRALVDGIGDAPLRELDITYKYYYPAEQPVEWAALIEIRDLLRSLERSRCHVKVDVTFMSYTREYRYTDSHRDYPIHWWRGAFMHDRDLERAMNAM